MATNKVSVTISKSMTKAQKKIAMAAYADEIGYQVYSLLNSIHAKWEILECLKDTKAEREGSAIVYRLPFDPENTENLSPCPEPWGFFPNAFTAAREINNALQAEKVDYRAAIEQYKANKAANDAIAAQERVKEQEAKKALLKARTESVKSSVPTAKRAAKLNADKAKFEKERQQRWFARQEKLLEESGEFDPKNVPDARDWTISAIVRRRGQPAFRNLLLKLYQTKCAISECPVEEALEAAHIVPYKGPKTNHPSNGLLLRTDLHTLFDLGFLAIDTRTMIVLIASELKGTCYQEFDGKKLTLPSDRARRPSCEALDEHRKTRSKLCDAF